MAFSGKPGAIALRAVALAAGIAWWGAWAQVQPAGQTPPPTRDPGYTFEQAGERKDTIDCMAFLGRCSERAKACETQRAQCESSEAMLGRRPNGHHDMDVAVIADRLEHAR